MTLGAPSVPGVNINDLFPNLPARVNVDHRIQRQLIYFKSPYFFPFIF